MASIKVPAIRYEQNGNVLYNLVVNPKTIYDFATVSLLEQNEQGDIVGFQRPEIKDHIREIQRYAETSGAFIPNAIILGFLKSIKFEVLHKEHGLGLATISYTEKNKPAFVVDGQQRLRALEKAETPGDFLMSVVAFVAEDEAKLKETFVRVNSSKPLQAGLLRTLLPGIDAEINAKSQKQRLPIELADRLNRDQDSPFYGRIKTSVNPSGYISDMTMIRMLTESLTNGYLFNLRGDEDMERMVKVQKTFWTAVSEVWPDAWDLPPAASRITHTAGIMGLGHLFDQIGDVSEYERLTKTKFVGVLKKMKPVCHWTEDSGDWDLSAEGRRGWNGIENTGRGVSVLKAHLNREYRKLLSKGSTEDAA